jgi:hypothetical protein
VEGIQAYPQFGALATVYLHRVHLRQILRRRGIALIRRKIFVSEWQEPLRPVDLPYLKMVEE